MALKILLLVLLLLVVMIVIGKRRRPSSSDPDSADTTRRGSGPPPPAPMRVCAHCGVHLPLSEALTGRDGLSYCSDPHRIAGPG
ncbi:MAG: PP0621 family protein [Rubrivivax sp.]